MDGLGVIALGVLVLLLTPIVASDLLHRRIPDLWTLLLGGAGVAYGLIRDPSWGAAGWAALQLVVVFAVLSLCCWILARLGRSAWIGGGDVKFLLAACAWVGMEGATAVLVLAGLILSVVTAIDRAPAGGGRWSQLRPFGPMLAAALFMVAAAVELIR